MAREVSIPPHLEGNLTAFVLSLVELSLQIFSTLEPVREKKMIFHFPFLAPKSFCILYTDVYIRFVNVSACVLYFRFEVLTHISPLVSICIASSFQFVRIIMYYRSRLDVLYICYPVASGISSQSSSSPSSSSVSLSVVIRYLDFPVEYLPDNLVAPAIHFVQSP